MKKGKTKQNQKEREKKKRGQKQMIQKNKSVGNFEQKDMCRYFV